MTGYRPPWELRPLDALRAVPVCVDPEVPAGTAVLVVDPEEPRHIQRINIHDANEPMPQALTDEQVEQIRDHYRAMDERGGRLLAEWQELAARFGFQGDPRP